MIDRRHEGTADAERGAQPKPESPYLRGAYEALSLAQSLTEAERLAIYREIVRRWHRQS